MVATYFVIRDGEREDVTQQMIDCYLPSARGLYVGERDAEDLAEQHAMQTFSEDLGVEVRRTVRTET